MELMNSAEFTQKFSFDLLMNSIEILLLNSTNAFS